MKRIEKLAREDADRATPHMVGEWKFKNSVEVSNRVDGFQAGFRAAREMAAKEAEELANPKSLVDDSFGEYIAEAIRALGEEEAGD